MSLERFYARFEPFVSFLTRVKMTEASASTSVRKKIKFNGNLYDDWSAVRDAYTSVCKKSRAKGVWGVVRLDLGEAWGFNRPIRAILQRL
jgi:hypothetical protein